MKAGPRNGQMRMIPRVCPSSDRRAARLTAASPGRTSSGSTFSEPPRLSLGPGGPESSPGIGSARPTSSPASSCSLIDRPAVDPPPPPAPVAHSPPRLSTPAPHALLNLSAQRMGGAADLDDQRPAERLAALHHQTGSPLGRGLRGGAAERGGACPNP